MAPLRYAAKFDPFLSLDCAPTPSTPAQSKERKGSNFAIWQSCDSYGRKKSDIGLNSMRKPKIHTWDNMGILGLTTKIWNDTKTRQETFMSSTGSFLREESMYQGVM